MFCPILNMNTYRYARLALAVMFFFLTAGLSSAQPWYTVKWVNDGDTIVLTNGWRVRYIGIDAPEIDYENHKSEPYGDKALSFNKKLVLSQKIGLEFDKDRHDRYGRLLAYIFLADHSFVNSQIVGCLPRRLCPCKKMHQRILEL